MSLICKHISASELILWFKVLKLDEKINSWGLSLYFHAHCAAIRAQAMCVCGGVYKILSNHPLETRLSELGIAVVLCGLLYDIKKATEVSCQ